MGYGLGVDLGTSFTAVAIGRHGRTRIVALGDDPISRSSLREVDESVPLVLGGRPYPAVAVLAEALRSTLAAVTAAEGEPPEVVVLTCPAVWGPARRQQFGEVSRRAGLTSVTVVSEPEAAVTGLVDGRKLAEDDVVLVYDIGGVTVDLTVVRVTDSGMEILGLPEGADGAGGTDFDDLILAHVDRQVGGVLSELDLTDPVAVGVLTGIRAECVRAKELLSQKGTATVRMTGLAGVAGLSQEIEPVRLTRGELETMIREPLTSTLGGLRRVLDSAGVQTSDLTAVVLVGGSSRIPLVKRMLSESLGRPVLVDEHPQHCVALGAAAIADGTDTIADGVRRITPGAPPVTDSIPTIAAAAAKIAAAAKSAASKADKSKAEKKKAESKAESRAESKAEITAKSAASKAELKAELKAAAKPGPGPGPGTVGFIAPAAITAAIPIAAPGLVATVTPLRVATAAPVATAVITALAEAPTPIPAPSPSLAEETLPADFPIGCKDAVDVTVPVLPRRAGGHRMPRMVDWRRRADSERDSVAPRRWRVITVTVLTGLLIGGATYVFTPLGTDPDSTDPDVNALAVGSSYEMTETSAPTPTQQRTATTAPAYAAPTTTKLAAATNEPSPSSSVQSSDQTEATPSGPAVTRAGLLVGLAGRCLDVRNGDKKSGTVVQIFRCNGGPSQIWSVVEDGTLRAFNKCLQVVETGAADPRLQIRACNDRATQQWVVSSGVVVNPRSAECLDVLATNPKARTPVITADCGGGAGQTWFLLGR